MFAQFKLTNYHVPVLFATSEGLYLRILESELAVGEQQQDQQPHKQQLWTLEPQFCTELCDIVIDKQQQQPSNVAEHADQPAVQSGELADIDSGFYEHSARSEETRDTERNKKRVQFRNTVVNISEAGAGSGEERHKVGAGSGEERHKTGAGRGEEHHGHHQNLQDRQSTGVRRHRWKNSTESR